MIILGILMLILLGLLGALIATTLVPAGPLMVLAGGALAALVVAALIIWLLRMGEFDDHSESNLAGALAIIAMMIAPVFTVGSGIGEYSSRVNDAPALQTYALTNFSTLDGVGGDLIVESDLDYVLDQIALTQTDRKKVEYMKEHLDEIGHVIDSYTTTGLILVGKVLVPTTTTHYVYGIDRHDLDTYVTRMQEKYENW